MVMTVVVFGSTGSTGLAVVDTAIKKGMKVQAFLRDPSRLPEEYRDRVRVVTGNVLSRLDVNRAIKDVDAVVVALGTRNDLKPTTDLSQGMKNIIEAMKTNSVELVSVCLSAFLFLKPEEVPKMFVDINDDHQRMYDAIKSSNLRYIAVLPPFIKTDAPSSNYVTKIDASPGREISKWDLGKFLVDSLLKSELHGKSVGIANV